MNIKQNNRILNFGATSELSKEILSRVAKKLNPVGVDGVVSPKAKEYLSTFSSWATSQGVSDELKRYMLPLPKGHQSTCPDAAGLEKTILENALFDEAMKNVIKEMYQESSQMNFADEGFKVPEGAYSAGVAGLTAAGLAYLMTEDEKKKAKNALLSGITGASAAYIGANNTDIGKKIEGNIRDFVKPKEEASNSDSVENKKIEPEKPERTEKPEDSAVSTQTDNKKGVPQQNENQQSSEQEEDDSGWSTGALAAISSGTAITGGAAVKLLPKPIRKVASKLVRTKPTKPTKPIAPLKLRRPKAETDIIGNDVDIPITGTYGFSKNK